MIKRLITMIVAVSMILMLVVGCSEGTEVTNGNGEQGKSQVEENIDVQVTKPPNEITLCESWGFQEGFSTVRTFENSSNFGIRFYLGNFYETLVNYEDGKIVPGLAESWSVSEDGLVYIFTLRKGVKFSDGSDFNAEVVKMNLDRIPELLGKLNGSYGVVTTLIKEVKVVEDYIVEVHLTSPYYAALHDFTMLNPLGIMSINAFNEDGTLTDKLLTTSMGTGPYMFDSQKDDIVYTFIRNPHYWGNKPDVDKFNIKVIPDNESKSLALRSGEIDMIFGASKISYDSFKEYSEDKSYRTKKSDDSIYTRFIGFDLAKEPFNDKNVRLAIAYAIDKQNICSNLLYDIETKADTFFSSSLPYCDVVLTTYKYDVDHAKQLLERAGWKDLDKDGIREKDGKKLEGEIIYTSGMATVDDIALTVVASLKEIGMDVRVTGLDMMACYSKAQKGNFNMIFRQSYGMPNDPFAYVMNMRTDSLVDNVAAQSLVHVENCNDIISSLTALVDKDEIQDKYDFILNEIHNNISFIPISYTKELGIFKSDKIIDYEFNGQPLNVDISGIEMK